MLQFPSLPHESKAAFPCSNAVAPEMAAAPMDLELLSLMPESEEAAPVQSEVPAPWPALQDVAPEPGAYRSR